MFFMTILYEDADLIAVYKQKKKLFYIYLLFVLAYAAICIWAIIYYVNLPFADPLQALPKWLVFVITCIFIIFSYIYLGIKYHRVRKYYKLVYYLSVGLKSVNHSIFVRYEEPELKDGVDYYVLTMSEWNKKKQEYLDRKIYCAKEKPLPQFECGDKLCYLTQGNVMIGYEIIGHDDEFKDPKKS